AGAIALVVEQLQVEALDVETAQVSAVEELQQLADLGREGGGRRHVGVADAMDGGRAGGDRDARVGPAGQLLALAVGVDLEDAELDNAIRLDVGPGRLQIEDGERPLQGEMVHGQPSENA